MFIDQSYHEVYSNLLYKIGYYFLDTQYLNYLLYKKKRARRKKINPAPDFHWDFFWKLLNYNLMIDIIFF